MSLAFKKLVEDLEKKLENEKSNVEWHVKKAEESRNSVKSLEEVLEDLKKFGEK